MPSLIMRCPICKREVPADSSDAPFCSDRCRIIDLGNWASEKYVIPASAGPDDFDDADEWLREKARLQEGSD